MSDDRDKLLARIRALLAKTVEAGCTEAEALAFAEKAHELIERYQIDLGAEEIKREGFVTKRIKMERARFAFARRILLAINEFCEVRTWYTTFVGQAEISVLGLRSDAELASYLIDSLTNFALAGADLHVAVERKMALAVGEPMTAAQSREAHRSHLVGCASRIHQRLDEMVVQRRAGTAAPGSRALVALDKPALVQAEMDRQGIKLCAGSFLTGGRDRGSFAAGAAHGTKATFGRPVAGGRIAGLITRGRS
jgi:Protein of unknown function (DUF2786)